jgi:hypothetical protein
MQFVRYLALSLVLAFCAPLKTVALEQMDVDAYSKRPPSESCRRVDFDKVEIIPGIVNGTWFAVVSGMKPWATMRVDLVPLIYIAQPDYWGIEVVGCLTGISLPMVSPYVATLPLQNFLGKKGIEIIGANQSKKFDVPPQ